MDRTKHTIDKEAAKSGIRLEYDGSFFTVASNTAPAFGRALQRARKKHAPAALAKDVNLERECTMQAAAETLLLKMEDVTDGGKPMADTYDNRLGLLRDCPEFREWVLQQADNLANFGLEAEAADGEALKSQA